MTSLFWQALERIGANGAAACDWLHHLGPHFDNHASFLKQSPGQPETIIDPKLPSRRLIVLPEEGGGFLGAIDDDEPDGPPARLHPDDVKLLVPDWTAIADHLGRLLGFTPNRYETDGMTRQIGTAQGGGHPVRPVILCLPAGHFGDSGRIHRDLAARQDASVLLPSAGWITPQVQALASANRLTITTLREHFEVLGKDATVDPPALAEPRPVACSPKRPKPLLVIQPGWTWENVTLEVATAGRVIFCCGGQRKEYRFPKRNGKKHSEGYAILMELAANPEWKNPRSWEADHEAVRKRFIRLEKDLKDLLNLPDRPFNKEDGLWHPVFQIKIHEGLRKSATSGMMADAERNDVPPIEGAYYDCHR